MTSYGLFSVKRWAGKPNSNQPAVSMQGLGSGRSAFLPLSPAEPPYYIWNKRWDDILESQIMKGQPFCLCLGGNWPLLAPFFHQLLLLGAPATTFVSSNWISMPYMSQKTLLALPYATNVPMRMTFKPIRQNLSIHMHLLLPKWAALSLATGSSVKSSWNPSHPSTVGKPNKNMGLAVLELWLVSTQDAII